MGQTSFAKVIFLKMDNSWLFWQVEGKDDGEGEGRREGAEGLICTSCKTSEAVPLLLNALNYRSLQAVPRPFLGPRHYNKRIVCLRGGSAERRLHPASSVSPCNAEKVHCSPEQPGGMKAMNRHSIWCVLSPGNPLWLLQDDLITHGAAGAPLQERGESRRTWAQHVFGMKHLRLYTAPFPGNCQEEKSINASKVFSKQTLGLCKPCRSGVWWMALSAFLQPAPEAPNPPSTWLLPEPVRASKMKFLRGQGKELRD